MTNDAAAGKPAGSPGNIAIENNETGSRYQTQIEGHLAVLEYQLHGNQILLNHTVVPRELEGRGLGGRLAKTALDEAQARNRQVVPNCPFVAEYIRRHQEYLPVVAPEHRARVTAA